MTNDNKNLEDYLDSDGEQGYCPRCGKEILEYGEMKLDGNAVVYPWKCNHCGATGKEVYALEFAGHFHGDK